MARKIHWRIIVSGMTASWTRIQMISPTPRIAVSHGAAQLRSRIRAASTSIPMPFITNR